VLTQQASLLSYFDCFLGLIVPALAVLIFKDSSSPAVCVPPLREHQVLAGYC
jgi:hypothetical protein